MGKYTLRPKASGDVSAMDVTQSWLGVRTRARNSFLRSSLQSSSVSDVSTDPPKPDFLELRSRRLEKSPQLHISRKAPAPKQAILCGDGENPRIEVSPENPCSGSVCSVGREKDEVGGFGSRTGDLETEVSFGESNFDMEVRERTSRESSPCNLIRTTDTIMMSGSSTKQRTPAVTNPRFQGLLRSIPAAHEIEEFFTLVEEPKQCHFINKYNFDIVNDMPLPGRYEWVRVMP